MSKLIITQVNDAGGILRVLRTISAFHEYISLERTRELSERFKSGEELEFLNVSTESLLKIVETLKMLNVEFKILDS